MVQSEEDKGFDKLGLDGGGPDGEDGLVGEDRGALGDGPDVAGELEVLQKGQKLLAEAALGAQVVDVLLVKAQLLDVLHHLGQARCNGKAPLVRDGAVEHVEVADAVLQAGLKVAIGHGQLVEVAQHGQICLRFHQESLLCRGDKTPLVDPIILDLGKIARQSVIFLEMC